MKTRLFTVFLMVTAAAHIFGDPPVAYPILTVDDAHLQLAHPDGSQPVFYEMAPAQGALLDFSKYKFRIPPQLKVDGPNSVQVLIGHGGQYSAEWKPKDGQQVVNASNLKPLKQSAPFAGFQSGDTVVFGIGHSKLEGNTLQFSVIWVGMAKVK